MKNETHSGRLGGDESSLTYPVIMLVVIVQFGSWAWFQGILEALSLGNRILDTVGCFSEQLVSGGNLG